MNADKRGCFLVAKNIMSENVMTSKYLTASLIAYKCWDFIELYRQKTHPVPIATNADAQVHVKVYNHTIPIY